MTEAKAKKDALTLFIGEDTFPIVQESLLNKEQLNLLATRTPEKYIKKRKGRGKQEFDYVEINYVIGVLNAIFGFNWSVEIKSKVIDTKSDNVIVEIRLTVQFANGTSVTKDAFGGSTIKRTKDGGDIIDLADDLKSAESDGIKKAASMLGIAWDVYSGLSKNNGNSNTENADYDILDGIDQVDEKDAFRTIPIVLSNGKKKMVTKFEAYGLFGKVKAVINSKGYYAVLDRYGVQHCNDLSDKNLPVVYAELLKILSAENSQ